ncbi:oligomeric complex COG6-domain-containing protein [Rhypophila decipiens]|uniref:Conserved oligomeric Golgi complex subunit 6 n=1 Tax=Rhypophila decipiens TaxID=261697 RepID=A0AAN6YD31_9PEZI|nr:oligomeric complex COG6-domain-containing protein [Rhypophila decipiens]
MASGKFGMAASSSLPARDISGPLSPQSPTAPTTAKGVNPLSSKVASVLSTSYADTEFREALSLLDGRGLVNTAETRRKLRLELQKEVINSNGEIIAEFAKVAEQLRRIGNTIGKLNESYAEIKTQIGAAHTDTSRILDEASQLMTQRQQVESKQDLLKAFNGNFILSEDEVAALTLSSEPVDDLFFAVLARAKKISKDCEVLLGFEDQVLGLEIMDQTSRNLNLGFQKLYRWIQREFKTLNLENPQIGSSIRRALRVLTERPSLFQNCLDFFAEARENVLSDSFYTALTGASVSAVQDTTVKPIELVAHDPLRYVGDMLAWSHSAAVGEREALEILFISEGDEIAKGIRAGRENEVWRLAAEDGDEMDVFDPVTALNQLVDRDMSGAVRILRQRVEQVIQTNEDTILAYKLANLLTFYKTTFSKLLGANSVLVESLGLLESEALRQFRSLARDHIAALQGEFQHTPSDLRPPDFLSDALEQLSSIMRTYETSLDPASDRESDFAPILAEVFDPFISGCVNMARNISPPSDSIFLVNCFLAAKIVLSRFDFTQNRTSDLAGQVEEAKKILAESQYRFFRIESGLDSLIASLSGLGEKEQDVARIRSLEPVQPGALTQTSQALDDFLPSALMDAMENLRHLQDSKLARDITEEAAERFCVDFEHVEEMLMLADEMAEKEVHDGETPDIQSLRALFPRTSGEIRVLLSIEQLKQRRDAGATSATLNCKDWKHRMLRNKTAVSVLQKTYDESYLTCSTAVYYESQGNEDEAMRCWRLALDQIYDHHANRVIPNYTPRSETEKALVDSLRQLELQCKERIDLLEALRLSRQENGMLNPSSTASKPLSEPTSPPDHTSNERGWIGAGTIPAVTYTELSRPMLPKRPSLSGSIPPGHIAGRSRSADPEDPVSPSPLRRPVSPPIIPSPERTTSKSTSPERHTMRTTLRTSRQGDKGQKQRHPSSKYVDGPGASKAATLAWSSLGQREGGSRSPAATTPPVLLPPAVSSFPADQPRRSSELSQRQWDRHSRRLVTPSSQSPTRLLDERPLSETAAPRRSSDYFELQSPSPSLSLSAASTALNSRSGKNAPEMLPPQGEPLAYQRPSQPRTPRRRIPSEQVEEGGSVPKGSVGRSSGRKPPGDSVIPRKPVGAVLSASKNKATAKPKRYSEGRPTPPSSSSLSSSSEDSSNERERRLRNRRVSKRKETPIATGTPVQQTELSEDETDSHDPWKLRKAQILKRLPPGVDEQAAKQILNEIVIQGDEVHWSDIAGLEIAKNALRETVVYPFLRPDLFMGLREPARGMLLFGPPGTGKTMLARAVATESKSTFFSISASSLTSKYLGDSEKLVRALFGLAKLLAPSIIFVDEIDSLLSKRSGSGDNEATRRIKTEFLIQWSDLQRAAAGKEIGDKERERGDVNRVLVLAATNLPWAIDEAARRRFVRRQYIPLPEPETRATQFRKLLSQQNHTLKDADIQELVRLTDGFSGSDITALAKDAAMGPLRSLGDALLHMTMEDIRPIELSDFIASLATIRPSVSSESLKEYEAWASQYGERGG